MLDGQVLGGGLPAGNVAIEGRLTITLDWVNGRVSAVDVSSSRPYAAPRIFYGKGVDDLLATLPRLYSVCGTAQACAAVSACESALGVPQSPAVTAARQILVLFETAKEHIWRVAIDWPVLLEAAGAPQTVAQVLQLMQSARRALDPQGALLKLGGVAQGTDLDGQLAGLEALMADLVFGMPAADWVELADARQLANWCEHCDTPAARMTDYLMRQAWLNSSAASMQGLPELDLQYLNKKMQETGFIAQPSLAGTCYETSPYTRAADHPLIQWLDSETPGGLLARFVARLVELARLPGQIRQLLERVEGASQPDTRAAAIGGVGFGLIEAARGRLLHRAEVAESKVVAYQILAPTEWNFHPEGVLASALTGAVAEDEEKLRRLAAFWVNAIDPCVGYEVRVRS